jgi:hypothetical protein
MARKVRHVFVLGLIAFVYLSRSSTLAATDPAQEITKQLAGSDARKWVFAKFDTFMSAKRCKHGETYLFTVQHFVTISSCGVDGRVHDEIKQWSIETQDPRETRVKIGDEWYVLIFWKTTKEQFMALRTKGNSKVEPTVDKEFRLAED